MFILALIYFVFHVVIYSSQVPPVHISVVVKVFVESFLFGRWQIWCDVFQNLKLRLKSWFFAFLIPSSTIVCRSTTAATARCNFMRSCYAGRDSFCLFTEAKIWKQAAFPIGSGYLKCSTFGFGSVSFRRIICTPPCTCSRHFFVGSFLLRA